MRTRTHAHKPLRKKRRTPTHFQGGGHPTSDRALCLQVYLLKTPEKPSLLRRHSEKKIRPTHTYTRTHARTQLEFVFFFLSGVFFAQIPPDWPRHARRLLPLLFLTFRTATRNWTQQRSSDPGSGPGRGQKGHHTRRVRERSRELISRSLAKSENGDAGWENCECVRGCVCGNLMEGKMRCLCVKSAQDEKRLKVGMIKKVVNVYLQ